MHRLICVFVVRIWHKQVFSWYLFYGSYYLDRVKRIWYLSPMRAAKVQASLRIHAVSPEPPLLAHTSSESRGTFRQKARSLTPLNGWACAVKICNDGMLEDTNSLDRAHFFSDIKYWLNVCHEIGSKMFENWLTDYLKRGSSLEIQRTYSYKVGKQQTRLTEHVHERYWKMQHPSHPLVPA